MTLTADALRAFAGLFPDESVDETWLLRGWWCRLLVRRSGAAGRFDSLCVVSEGGDEVVPELSGAVVSHIRHQLESCPGDELGRPLTAARADQGVVQSMDNQGWDLKFPEVLGAGPSRTIAPSWRGMPAG